MSSLDSLYQQIILEHSKTRSGGDLPESETAAAPGTPGVGQCHQLNPVCGDEITLRLELSADRSTVAGIHWNGDGCAISMASASILSEEAAGADPRHLKELIDTFRDLMRSRGSIEADEEVLGDAAALAGVSKYPARVKCAMLAWVAAEDALRQALAE
ncbi:Fe-S cluster assembly sulfur transfer protein SufU [Pseudarthrobacter sp. J1738]|uniref:Fe-S cluster assembly sulfur transfer protein SufU n=1 Tax=unclassified Pseudarthrobacter TaxID=2647000 RepID=UPI003D2C6642